MREKTHAHRNLVDDVSDEAKQKRLAKMIEHFLEVQLQVSTEEIGRYHLVLVDGTGKKPQQLKGKTDTYRTVVFESSGKAKQVRSLRDIRSPADQQTEADVNKGDYVLVRVASCSPTTLKADLVGKIEMARFFELSGGAPFFALPPEQQI